MKHGCLWAAMLLGGCAPAVPLPANDGPVLPAVQAVLGSAAQLRDGDLVFRRGRDGRSALVLAGQQGSRFSHVGMVLHQQGRPMIMHATPGEGDLSAGVHLESLVRFLDMSVASDAAVYRHAGLEEADRQRMRQWLLSVQGRPFDYAFSLATAERLYCSELVLVALQTGGMQLSPVTTQVSLVVEPVVLPDALRQLPGLVALAGE